MAANLSFGLPFLTNFFCALSFFRIKFLMDWVIQGACRGLTVIVLLGMKVEKIFSKISVNSFGQILSNLRQKTNCISTRPLISSLLLVCGLCFVSAGGDPALCLTIFPIVHHCISNDSQAVPYRSSLDCGSMFFSLRRDERAFFILPLRLLYCSFHVRFSSTIIPRYLTC